MQPCHINLAGVLNAPQLILCCLFCIYFSRLKKQDGGKVVSNSGNDEGKEMRMEQAWQLSKAIHQVPCNCWPSNSITLLGCLWKNSTARSNLGIKPGGSIANPWSLGSLPLYPVLTPYYQCPHSNHPEVGDFSWAPHSRVYN